jgi:hypothetical protein
MWRKTTMLSRRRLITVGAAAGAASLLSPPLLKAGSATNAGSAQSTNVADYLTITAPSDPNFVPTLNKLFPGLLEHPTFQKMQSHAVLLTNISSKPLMAYSTHWKATTPTGGYETTLRHYFHPSRKRKQNHSSRFGVRGEKTRFTGSVPAIKPGATRLVTPYFNWSPHHYQKKPNPQWKHIVRQKASRKFFHHELSKATAIQVTVDAVVVNHHTVIGPDRTHLGKVLSVTRNAEHDEALVAHRMLANGASIKQVAARLKVHAKSPLPQIRAISLPL